MITHTARTVTRPALAEAPVARRRPNPRPVPRAGIAHQAAPTRQGPNVSPVPAPSPVGRPGRAALLRRRFVVAALTVAVAGGALAVGFQVGHAGAELEGPPPAAPVYVVQPGDTLWVIAERLAPEVDAQRAVAALVRSAGGASLTPGQRIVVPTALR